VKSNNPALGMGFNQYGQYGAQGSYGDAYAAPRSVTMTVQGTVSKTFLLLAILSATALWAWGEAARGGVTGWLLGGAAIGGFIVAMITCFRPAAAPWTAPVYAALEGVFLGALSKLIEMSSPQVYHGIAIQAVGLTCGTLFLMLTLFLTRTIRVTGKLAAGIMAATGAVALLYFVTFILHMFHVDVPFIHAGGKVGILFSLFVVGLAAFNLLLDFDMIEQGVASGAPKSMEWYGAFGLMVTLVWLYLEVLRLLQKVYNERR
jgi:uncharacterized YccA/Bax inhibitor family protein